MTSGLPEPVELGGSTMGLLSDSHGRYERTARAVEVLMEHEPDVLVHLGDICDSRVIDALSGLPVPVRFVWGNMDDGTPGERQYAEGLGLVCDHPAGAYRMAGKLVVATHGHVAWVEEAARQLGADYLLHGHTHLVRDEQIGGLRAINPGALQRAQQYTVGVLRLGTGEFSVYEIEE
jgi:uncharacterized protein